MIRTILLLAVHLDSLWMSVILLVINTVNS